MPLLPLDNYKTAMQPRERPIPPEEERVKGTVFPYRGTEDHGVPSKPEYDADPLEYGDEDYEPPVEPKPGVDPVPVYIVETNRRELRKWHSYVSYVAGVLNSPGSNIVQLAGRNERRTRIRIYNDNALPANPPNPVLRISHSPSVLTIPSNGIPVQPGSHIELEHDDEIYGVVENWFDPAWDIRVLVSEEYRVAVK